MSGCIFCRIVDHEAPARIVYQDELVTAFHDINQRAPVHILIVPNQHLSGVGAVTTEDEAALGRLFTVARHLAQEFGIVAGYRLVVNNGPLAGQSVGHLHVHLLGGRPLSWPPG